MNVFLLQIRAFNTFTALEWAYLVISLIALTICLGITIERLCNEKPSKSDFTFGLLLLVTIRKNILHYHYFQFGLYLFFLFINIF